MDELMHRMEATVNEFNEEVKAMLAQLQGKKTIPRDNILSSSNRSIPPIPRKPAPAESFETPIIEPILEPTADPLAEPLDEEAVGFALEGENKPIKEVEIDVDLDGEELSEFEKKLRTLSI